MYEQPIYYEFNQVSLVYMSVGANWSSLTAGIRSDATGMLSPMPISVFASLDVTPFLAESNNDMPVLAHHVPNLFFVPIQKVSSKLLHMVVPVIV